MSKEVDIDVAVLSFNQLQIYYYNEIRRGFANKGNYTLKNEFLSLYYEIDEVELVWFVSNNRVELFSTMKVFNVLFNSLFYINNDFERELLPSLVSG